MQKDNAKIKMNTPSINYIPIIPHTLDLKTLTAQSNLNLLYYKYYFHTGDFVTFSCKHCDHWLLLYSWC